MIILTFQMHLWLMSQLFSFADHSLRIKWSEVRNANGKCNTRTFSDDIFITLCLLFPTDTHNERLTWKLKSSPNDSHWKLLMQLINEHFLNSLFSTDDGIVTILMFLNEWNKNWKFISIKKVFPLKVVSGCWLCSSKADDMRFICIE